MITIGVRHKLITTTMKVTGLLLVLLLSLAAVNAEINASCNSDKECDTDNQEECVMPSTAGSTAFPDGTTESTNGSTEPDLDPYTCQCKSGYHTSTVNDTSCAKDITEEDNYKCYLPIDCAEIDYPAGDYEEEIEVDPQCDAYQDKCTCGEQTDVKFWFVAMDGDQAACFHKAIEENEKLKCNYTQECEFLSKNTGGAAVCNKEQECECSTKGYELYQDKLWTCGVALGGPCEKDDDCSKIEHASCSIEDGEDAGTCECTADYPDKEHAFRCSSAASLMSSLITLVAALWLSKLGI